MIRASSPQAKLDLASVHRVPQLMKNLCEVFNSYSQGIRLGAEVYPARVKAEIDYCHYHGGDSIILPESRYAANGYMSFSQMASLAEVIDALYARKRDRLLIMAPTQWGKTALVNMLLKILPVIHKLKTGRNAVVVVSVPANLSLLSQSYERLRKSWRACNSLTVKSRRNQMQVRDYWDALGIDPSDPDMQLVFNRSTKGEKELLSRVNELLAAGFDVIYVEDECHFGQDVTGISARIDRGLPGKVWRVVCSATPDEQLARPDIYHAVPVYVESGYWGIPFVYNNPMKLLGKTFDVPAYTRQIPLVLSVEERYGQALTSNGDFLKAVKQELTSGYTNGVFLRAPGRANWRAEELADLFENEGYKVVKFYDKMVTTMEALRETVPAGMKYVVIANQMARMGDTLPHDCYVAIDATQEFTYLNSAYQGTLGRTCGKYGSKQPVAIFSRRNSEWVKSFLNDPSLPAALMPTSLNKHKKASPRTEYNPYKIGSNDEKVAATFKNDRYFILRGEEHADKPLVADLMRQISQAKTDQKSNSNKERRKFNDLYKSILNPQTLMLLAPLVGVHYDRFAEYGNEDGHGYVLSGDRVECRYAVDRKEYSHVARSGGGHNRLKTPGEKPESVNQVVWRYEAGQIHPTLGCLDGVNGKKARRSAMGMRKEVFIIHLRLKAVTDQERAEDKQNVFGVLETNKRSRHHDLES